MESERKPVNDREQELQRQVSELYGQLTRQASRLLVVHEAGNILSSSQDAGEIAEGLLEVIGEALFTEHGCVARMKDDELAILSARGLDDAELDELGEDDAEAGLWFEVADGGTRLARAEIVAADPGAEPRFDLYVPLQQEGEVLGVLALGPRVDGRDHGPEDLQLADALASHLAVALHGAGLHEEKARRIEQLSVLLRISKEITSTLDLDRVLHTFCQMFSLVVPSQRVMVALEKGTGVEIRASSSDEDREAKHDDDPLLPALQWAYAAGQPLNVGGAELAMDEEAGGRELLLEALGEEGSLAVLPLEDDAGRLGLLAIQGLSDQPPLDHETEELAEILANQATVAIRNAELYSRIPMVSVLEPFMGRKGARGGRRFRKRYAVIAAVLLLGLLLPLPSWVSGDASVRPGTPFALRAATDGIVEEVLVREGEQVVAGQPLGALRTDALEAELDQLRAQQQQAMAMATRARSEGDLAGWQDGLARREELAGRERELSEDLARARFVAPIDGVVLSDRPELRVGARLERGQAFLEIGDLEQMEVEVQVPQEDFGRLEVGRSVSVKVQAFPGEGFEGEILRVAPRAGQGRSFRVVARVANPGGKLRPGMTGRARLDAADRPVLQAALAPTWRSLRLRFWF